MLPQSPYKHKKCCFVTDPTVTRPSSLHFRVGPYTYTAIVSKERMYDRDGNELDGLAIESRRLILLSPRLDRERREEVLLHEFQHCWEFHVPAAHNAEERCQLFATVYLAYREAIDVQGGAAAVLSLPELPAPRVGHRKGRRAIPAGRVS